MGKKKALLALAHLILRIAFHVLRTKVPYKELGSDYLVDKEKQKEEKLIKYLKSKGYQVMIAS